MRTVIIKQQFRQWINIKKLYKCYLHIRNESSTRAHVLWIFWCLLVCLFSHIKIVWAACNGRSYKTNKLTSCATSNCPFVVQYTLFIQFRSQFNLVRNSNRIQENIRTESVEFERGRKIFKRKKKRNRSENINSNGRHYAFANVLQTLLGERRICTQHEYHLQRTWENFMICQRERFFVFFFSLLVDENINFIILSKTIAMRNQMCNDTNWCDKKYGQTSWCFSTWRQQKYWTCYMSVYLCMAARMYSI